MFPRKYYGCAYITVKDHCLFEGLISILKILNKTLYAAAVTLCEYCVVILNIARRLKQSLIYFKYPDLFSP